MACLTIMDGALKGQTYTLTNAMTRIGRRDGNDWVIADGSVSGTHCEIEKNDNGFLLRDLGSTNGTKVNNEEIKEKYLFRNDVFYIGEVPLTIDGDDVPENDDKDSDANSIPRTTIVIKPQRVLETPKEFTKKTSKNKLWIAVIAVLLVVIAGLMVVLFTR